MCSALSSHLFNASDEILVHDAYEAPRLFDLGSYLRPKGRKSTTHLVAKQNYLRFERGDALWQLSEALDSIFQHGYTFFGRCLCRRCLLSLLRPGVGR